jgi:hypothetical protein
MNVFAKFAIAAAAVLVVAFAGFTLLPGNGGVGAPSPTQPPAATATSPSGSTPVTGVSALPSPGFPLAPGTHLVHDPFPLPVSLTVGDGWTSWSGIVLSGAAIYKGSPDPPGGIGVVVAIVDNVYADPCDGTKGTLDPPLGPTADDLVAALVGQPRTDASAVTDVTLDGYSGKYVEYTATAYVDECWTTLRRWPTVIGDREGLVGEHDKVWILDVDGTRLVIDAFSFPETTAADHAEVEAIVDSIKIEP